MPFTVAHPAIVIPFKKKWPNYFSLTGLMAGAMAPDLLYFLQMTTVNRGFSHSWPGLFLFCLPAGILFSLAFHWFFKYPFIQNLPGPFDRRLSGLAMSRFKPESLRSWLVLVISVILGAVSHFAWDSFTHAQGEMAQRIPFLLTFVKIFGHYVRMTTVAQHLSTLFGLSVMTYAFGSGAIAPEPDDSLPLRQTSDKLIFWLSAGLVSLLSGSIWVLFMRTIHPHYPVSALTLFGLASWAGFFYCVCTYSAAKRLLGRQFAEDESS